MTPPSGEGRAGESGDGAGGTPDEGSGAAGPVLTVDSIAGGGDGVARDADGRVVFVSRTAPGDRVRVEVVEERSSYARARVEKLVSAGPTRTTAPCPYYRECGGCQLQHLAYPAQLAAKREIVRDALARIGGRTARVPAPRTAGEPLGYRNRVSLTLRRSGSGVVAGYHGHRAPDRIVDVERCPLAEPPINRAWGSLRAAWGAGAGALPGTAEGKELRITIRSTADGEVGLLVEGGRPDDAGRPRRIAEATGAVGYLWKPARSEEGEARRPLSGRTGLRERWLGREVEVDLETFLQVNRKVAGLMEAHLDRLLGDPAGRRVLDLYAGLGLRAIRWAERGADAACCEVDPRAVETGRRVGRRAGVSVEARTGRVERHLPDLLPADDIVVNPPRTGLSRPVARTLRDARAGRIVYVSCDPATLARDVGRLGPAWEIVAIHPFDAFPQTAHVETILLLERRP